MKRSLESNKRVSTGASITSYFSPSKATKSIATTSSRAEISTDDSFDLLSGLLNEQETQKPVSKKRASQTVVTPPSPAKKSKRLIDKSQWSLDVGQKGATQCLECGMLFSNSSDEDRESHRIFHRRKTSALKVKISAKMNVVYTSPCDPTRQVVLLTKEDLRKVAFQRLIELVDEELHFNASDHTVGPNEQVYVYIANGAAVGAIRTEKIESACRLVEIPNDTIPCVSEGSNLDTSVSSTITTNSLSSASSSVVVCSKRSESAALGVSRIWVRESHKRQGIASILFDVARANFMFGTIIPKEKCAITQPTVEGRMFATSYFGMASFLVYEA
jgi:N-acetyltransferase